MAKLKLFRTSNGLTDSYVAAPSRPAALKAWGARTDLFAMGAAEQVNDPSILEAASKNPGTPLQRKNSATGKAGRLSAKRPPAPRKEAPKRELAPLRAQLNKLEKAHLAELRKIDKAIASLVRKRDQVMTRHNQASARIRTRIEDVGEI